jgi:hypothetical protein
VWKGIKDGVPATERGDVVLKALALKNFYCSHASGGVGLSPEDCRKRVYLAQAGHCSTGAQPLKLLSCMKAIVHRIATVSTPIREASTGSLQYKRLGRLL